MRYDLFATLVACRSPLRNQALKQNSLTSRTFTIGVESGVASFAYLVLRRNGCTPPAAAAAAAAAAWSCFFVSLALVAGRCGCAEKSLFVSLARVAGRIMTAIMAPQLAGGPGRWPGAIGAPGAKYVWGECRLRSWTHEGTRNEE